MDFWGSLGDQKVCKELSKNLVLSQTEISEGEILGPVDGDRQETEGMSTSVTEEIEEMGMSEAETGGVYEEENEAGLEATDLDGDTTHSEKTSSYEDTKTEREAEPGTADSQDEALPGSASAGNSTDGDPESGEPEESSLAREPETETKAEGDHTSAREPESEEQVSQEDNASAEAVKETPASNESQSDQQTSSEKRLQDKDLLHDQAKGKVFSFFLTDLNHF